jgi:hypothetical protein
MEPARLVIVPADWLDQGAHVDDGGNLALLPQVVQARAVELIAQGRVETERGAGARRRHGQQVALRDLDAGAAPDRRIIGVPVVRNDHVVRVVAPEHEDADQRSVPGGICADWRGQGVHGEQPLRTGTHGSAGQKGAAQSPQEISS